VVLAIVLAFALKETGSAAAKPVAVAVPAER